MPSPHPSPPIELASLGRLPAPGDNAAIAIARIEAGTEIRLGEKAVATFGHTVLEGHRFAVTSIPRGTALLSWGLPFGYALRDIEAGEYICNAMTLEALGQRDVAGASLPAAPNFENRIIPYIFEETGFKAGAPTEPAPDSSTRTFLGYPRAGGRGAGTRNYIVLLGTTSRSAGYVRQLADRLQPFASAHPSLDGIVPIAHTEGEGPQPPNNLAQLLRALAGFIVNPNVGAVIIADYGLDAVSNALLRDFMRQSNYPLAATPHHFLTLRGSLQGELAEGEALVRAWMPSVAGQKRQPVPLSELRIGLQCGGSDAFSGVSANPLVGAVGREVVRYGGRVNLAETDELIGAESYVLASVRDEMTARRLLEKIAQFKERLGWHGATVEGNPSAGNRFRGLYNIVLKSLGAAMKKDPRTRLDHVIDYAEPMAQPGFTFMNSPGNDLESIAGQVAAGCTMIFFTTGNGSVTNFPFVPTLKITSTSRRHHLLENEMDVNAGSYLEGTPIESLCAEMFELVQRTASGEKTKGEKAGHSQVSIWRNWRQTDHHHVAAFHSRRVPDGVPLSLAPRAPGQAGRSALDASTSVDVFPTHSGGWAGDRIGLIVPTSMCSSQIARLAAERLNATDIGQDGGITRFVALPHTEGCGFTGETHYARLHRTYGGYAQHPSAALALFLEHGCEKIPNDVMRRQLTLAGADPSRFGWASVQLDGGIAKVLDRIEGWFTDRLRDIPAAERSAAPLSSLALGLVSEGAPASAAAAAFGDLARLVLDSGGTILIPEDDPLLEAGEFRSQTMGSQRLAATLAYGQISAKPGLHIVATETRHWVENLTGLGACGAQVILALVRDRARPGHPFIPVIQLAEAVRETIATVDDVDGFLSDQPEENLSVALEWVVAAASGRRTPASLAQGHVDFQLTRGLLGVST